MPVPTSESFFKLSVYVFISIWLVYKCKLWHFLFCQDNLTVLLCYHLFYKILNRCLILSMYWLLILFNFGCPLIHRISLPFYFCQRCYYSQSKFHCYVKVWAVPLLNKILVLFLFLFFFLMFCLSSRILLETDVFCFSHHNLFHEIYFKCETCSIIEFKITVLEWTLCFPWKAVTFVFVKTFSHQGWLLNFWKSSLNFYLIIWLWKIRCLVHIFHLVLCVSSLVFSVFLEINFYKDEQLSELEHLYHTPRLISTRRSVENLSYRSVFMHY